MYLPGKLTAKGLENCYEVKVALIENGKIYAVQNNALKSIKVETVFESFDSALIRGLPDGTVLVKDQISNSFEGMKVDPSN